MISDKLYELAFAYKKTKLWHSLWDTELVAIRLSGDRTGYICTGTMDAPCGLELYIGEKGYCSYRTIKSTDSFSMHSTEFQERILQQNCLQCSFTGKDSLSGEERQEVKEFARSRGIKLAGKAPYPQFTKYLAYHCPWGLQSALEQEDLCEALSGAIALAGFLTETPPKALGIVEVNCQTEEIPMLVRGNDGTFTLDRAKLPKYQESPPPEPAASNDISIARLKKLPRSGIWECEIIRCPEPVMDGSNEIPIFPIFVLAVDNSSDYILPLSPAIQYEENPEELLNLFMDALIMVKVCPAEIIARDKRTYAFAKSFCERMKIPLSINENLPALEDAEITFFERMQKNNDEKIDDIIDMLDQMLELDSTQLRNLPGDMVGQLEAIVKDNVLPENIKNKLNEVFHFDETGFPRLVKSNPQATKPVFKGSYVISVSLGTGCYRHIQISGSDTLFKLHGIILDAFGFDDDHAHVFFMDNTRWSDWDSYYAEGVEEGLRTTGKYKLNQIGLCKGKQFKYLFDFGDEWLFQCKVLREIEQGTAAPFVLKQKGDAPSQYPSWEDEDEGEDE